MMHFHGRNAATITKMEAAAMLRATEPDQEPDFGEGATVEYEVEEFEITAFGGLSLGFWTIRLTATWRDGEWARDFVEVENRDYGAAVTINSNVAALLRDRDEAAKLSALEMAIIAAIDEYLTAQWPSISDICDAEAMARE